MLPLALAACLSTSLASQTHPTKAQRAWQDLEIGVFIHFAPNTWSGQEYDDTKTPLSKLNPEKLDTDQWARTAKAFGARYVVFVAKHVGGFCMWQTSTTDYSLRSIPWRDGKGDVLGDLAVSCKKYGLRLGVYLSPQDIRHGAAVSGRCATPAEQKTYDALYRKQLTEVLTHYGSMCEIWFDGSQVVPVDDILAAHARDAMIFQGPHATIRWVGNEMGFAPYPAWNSLASADAKTGVATALHSDPNGDAWMPIEVDVSMRRPNWFWNSTDEANVLKVPDLLEIYYKSVGRGTNLLVNLTPDTTGEIPATDAKRAAEFGDEIRRRFGHPLATAGGRGSIIEAKLAKPSIIDHVVAEEVLSDGERVRAFRIEGLRGGVWQLLGEGSAIGHKRIQPVAPVEVSAVRLVVTSSLGESNIRRLAAFFTGTEPPSGWNQEPGLWAEDSAGSWTREGSVNLDLTTRVQAAATYRVRFVGAGGATAVVSDPVLLMDGSAQPHLVRMDPQRNDVVLVTMPGLAKSVRLTTRVSGAGPGSVLVRRL